MPRLVKVSRPGRGGSLLTLAAVAAAVAALATTASAQRAAPVHGPAREPEPSERIEHRCDIEWFLPGMAERRENGMAGAERGVLTGEGGQSMPRTNLQQDSLLSLCQCREAVGEANGLAQVRCPTMRIGRFLVGGPFPGEVRQVGNFRRIQPRFSDFGGKPVEHWLHHLRMKCV